MSATKLCLVECIVNLPRYCGFLLHSQTGVVCYTGRREATGSVRKKEFHKFYSVVTPHLDSSGSVNCTRFSVQRSPAVLPLHKTAESDAIRLRFSSKQGQKKFLRGGRELEGAKTPCQQ